MIVLSQDWKEALKDEFEKTYFEKLSAFIEKEYEENTVFPKKEEIFNALNYTHLNDVKVVILGQDPYHEVNQAHGLSFSVLPGNKIPPSLVNIYKELNLELGVKIPNNGYLKKWADQGVLLLNTVLTVKEGEANSHKSKGWEKFTDAVISKVNELDKPVVFMLWGAPSQKKSSMLNNPKHLVLKGPHPSPLSVYRGFFGCNHFKKANEFLEENGEKPIDWQIEDI